MSTRALSLATVMLVICCFGAGPVRAQNLEAGKTPAQIFAGSCTACHKGSRGLLKTVAPGSLPGFLRQHYTTSPDMAKMLSAYLISNGATDTRYRAEPPKQQPGDLKPAPRSEPEHAERHGRKPPREAARPDADGVAAHDEPHGRKDRHGKRIARPGRENPETAEPGAEPQAGEHDGRKQGAKSKKLTRRGKHGAEEPPKADAAGQESPKEAAKPEPAKEEPATGSGKAEAAKEDTPKTDASKADTSKTETSKDAPKDQAAKPEAKPDLTKTDGGKTGAAPDAAKSGASSSEADKAEGGKSEGTPPAQAATPAEPKAVPLRADPVPAVTPAPKSGEGEAKPAPAASSAPASSSPAAASPSAPAEPAKVETPATTAVTPPASAPPAPAGPPIPPISK